MAATSAVGGSEQENTTTNPGASVSRVFLYEVVQGIRLAALAEEDGELVSPPPATQLLLQAPTTSGLPVHEMDENALAASDLFLTRTQGDVSEIDLSSASQSLTSATKEALALHDLKPQDCSNHKKWSLVTPPTKSGQKIEIELKTYAPTAFRRIRTMSGVNTDQFCASWNYKLFELPQMKTGAGRSGSLFLASSDRRYFFKTLPYAEVQTLLAILPLYLIYLGANPKSKLLRIFGLLRFSDPRKAYGGYLYLVVFPNSFYSSLGVSVDEKFDLKGRVPKKGKEGRHSPASVDTNKFVFKDNDLKDRKFYLDHVTHDRLIETLQADVRFLSSLNCMDYSLLVGVHYLSDKDRQYIKTQRRKLLRLTEQGEIHLGHRLKRPKRPKSLSSRKTASLRKSPKKKHHRSTSLSSADKKKSSKSTQPKTLTSQSAASTPFSPSSGSPSSDSSDYSSSSVDNQTTPRSLRSSISSILVLESSSHSDDDDETTKSSTKKTKDLTKSDDSKSSKKSKKSNDSKSSKKSKKFNDSKSSSKPSSKKLKQSDDSKKSSKPSKSCSTHSSSKDPSGSPKQRPKSTKSCKKTTSTSSDDSSHHSKSRQHRSRSSRGKHIRRSGQKRRSSSSRRKKQSSRQRSHSLDTGVRDRMVLEPLLIEKHYGLVGTRGESYFISVIDFLSRYNLAKMGAHFFKTFLWNKETLSTVPADFYADRWMAFMQQCFDVADEEVSSSSLVKINESNAASSSDAVQQPKQSSSGDAVQQPKQSSSSDSDYSSD
eukprot:CAMPEP_0201561058 /NCGR_PEP_ID=MMETSP0173_2-20130828/78594_1 /ASSEMBLY_ACC=CAM_ASM_000268 /TAXON_ID=218659 /ORGANISM="Vexillifera sp., Strain DIVA3 564/2" /LENGTH=766 /DNA_ID=CAMNT_0047975533 /DNA_START=98 /DNA_END=2398 /DNA_ORIENTATION=-